MAGCWSWLVNCASSMKRRRMVALLTQPALLHDLDGDRPPQPPIAPQPDIAHATLAQQLFQFVPSRHRRPSHRDLGLSRVILRPGGIVGWGRRRRCRSRRMQGAPTQAGLGCDQFVCDSGLVRQFGKAAQKLGGVGVFAGLEAKFQLGVDQLEQDAAVARRASNRRRSPPMRGADLAARDSRTD